MAKSLHVYKFKYTVEVVYSHEDPCPDGGLGCLGSSAWAQVEQSLRMGSKISDLYASLSCADPARMTMRVVEDRPDCACEKPHG